MAYVLILIAVLAGIYFRLSPPKFHFSSFSTTTNADVLAPGMVNPPRTLPIFNAYAVQGASYQLGKPAIIEFWHSRCSGCRGLISHLNDLHDELQKKGWQVMSVSYESAAELQAFLAKNPLKYGVLSDPSQSLSRQFPDIGWGGGLIVNAQGKVVWKGPLELIDSDTLHQLVAE